MPVTVAELRNVVSVDINPLKAGATQATSIMSGLGAKMNSVGQSMTKVGMALSIGVTAPLVLVAKAALNAGSSFESAFAGVKKTVDATESELARMREGFRKMALEIPVTANELARIGEAAGALGVKTEDIMEFTRVMADLGVATNLSSDQAATGLARLANIMKSEAGPQFSQMAAALVALGNAGASTEAEILDMSLRIALAGKQAGLSKADILALSNALSSIGIEAEMGGSAISRAFQKMGDATKDGGKELQLFAEVAKMSAADFKTAFQTNAAGAMVAFVGGLQKMIDTGKSVTPVLEGLHLAELRVRASLTGAASAGDLFTKSLELGSKAFAENTAHTKEAAERYKTFDSQIQLVKNQLTDIAITVFEKLRPALTGMLDSIKGAISGFADLDEKTIKAGAAFLAVAGSAGPIALLIGKLVSLGPTGVIVGAAVGGSAAIAAAYASDFGTMNTTINNHFQLFRRHLGEVSTASIVWGEQWARVGIGIDVVLDKILLALQRVLVGANTFGNMALASLTGDIAGIIAAYRDGENRMADIDAVAKKNFQAREKARNDIAYQQWSRHYDAMTEVSRKGSQSMVDAADAVFSKNNPVSTMMDILKKGEGPIMSQSQKLGKLLGYGFRLGHDAEVYKSPYFALHSLTDALAAMMTVAKGAVQVGAAIGKGLRDGFKEQLGDAFKQVIDDINRKLNDIDIGKRMAEVGAPQIKLMIDRLKELSTTIDTKTVLSLEKLSATVLFGDGSFEKLINRMIDLKRASDAGAAEVKRLQDEFRLLAQDSENLARQLPQSWNTIINAITSGADKGNAAVLGMRVKIQGYAKDILDVFDTMPGKWGSALNKTLNEVNKWINFIDSALKLVQRIIGSEATGLAGIFESVAGSLKKSTDGIEASHEAVGLAAKRASQGLGQLGEDLQKSGDEAEAAAGKWVKAVAGVVAGISMFMGSRHQGLGAGILGGALGGFTAGAAIGSVIPGLGTLIGGGIGAAIGAIAGIFGSGKSSAQKTAEADAMKAAKLSAEQTGQQIVGTYIDNLSKALDFFSKVDEFQQFSQKKFNQFMNAFRGLLTRFVELMKVFANENLAKAKELAETVGPIADAISRLPLAFDGIGKHMKVPKGQFDIFFRDFSRMMGHFFALAEEWIDGQSKQAQKVAERLAPVIGIFAPLIEAITNMAGIEDVSNRAFKNLFRALERFVDGIAKVSDLFDKAVLKSIENFALKISPATDLWKSVTEAIKGMFDVQLPSDASFSAIFTGIEQIINGMTALADRLDIAAVEKAESIAQSSLAIFASIKAGVESLTALKDFTGVLPEIFTTFFNDFNAAVDMVTAMAQRAMQFDSVSKTFESYIASGAASLAHAFTMLSQIMNAAGAFFPGGSPTTAASTVGISSLSSGSLASLSSNPLGSSAPSAPTTVVVNFYGTVIDEQKVEDVVVRAIQGASRRGRLAPI